MTADPDHPHLAHLLSDVKEVVIRELYVRLYEGGYDDIRQAHGCVFRFVDIEEGSRLTDLAERAGMTKQAVGELVTDLQALGYVERVPDPSDGRAKIVRLTERGREAHRAALEAFAAIESDWAERLGERRVGELRELLEEIAAGAQTRTAPRM